MARQRTKILKYKGERRRYDKRLSLPRGKISQSPYAADYPTTSPSSYSPTVSWWPTVTWSPTEQGYQYYSADDLDEEFPVTVTSTSIPTPAPSFSSHEKENKKELISTKPTSPPSAGIVIESSLQGNPCSFTGKALIENKVVFMMMVEYESRGNLLPDDIAEVLMHWIARFFFVCDEQVLVAVDQRPIDHSDSSRQGSIIMERIGLAKVSSCQSWEEASNYCSILRGEIAIMSHPMYIDDFRDRTLSVVKMFANDRTLLHVQNVDLVDSKYLGPDVPSLISSSALDRSESLQFFVIISFLIPLMTLICVVHRYRFALLRFRNTPQY